jgi:tetratricopeptide (TPR) repeat protein
MRRRDGLAALALAGLLAGSAAAAEQDDLLRALAQGPAAERRAAAERLGEVGDGGATAGLAGALHDGDAEVRGRAAGALWAIWHRSGTPAIDALLQGGIALMEARRLPEAVAVFSEVIRQAPDFAEGWNKRATVYYLMGEWDRSLADCDEVLRRNPIHFGALAGAGLNHVQKDDLPRAVEAFERALRVNPDLSGIERLLGEIREKLQQRQRETI